MSPILPEHSHCGLLSTQILREYRRPESLYFESNRVGPPLVIYSRNIKYGKIFFLECHRLGIEITISNIIYFDIGISTSNLVSQLINQVL